MVSEVSRALLRCMMVLNIGQEIENYIMELGNEGRLVKMQLDELVSNVEEEAILIIQDYSRFPDKTPNEIFDTIKKSFQEEVADALPSPGYWVWVLAQYPDMQAARGGTEFCRNFPIPSQVIENLVVTFGDFPYYAGLYRRTG